MISDNFILFLLIMAFHILSKKVKTRQNLYEYKSYVTIIQNIRLSTKQSTYKISKKDNVCSNANIKKPKENVNINLIIQCQLCLSSKDKLPIIYPFIPKTYPEQKLKEFQP